MKIAEEVLVALKARNDMDAINLILDKLPNNTMSETDSESSVDHMKFLVECLMMSGSKSFSHIMNVIERHIKLIKSITRLPEQKIQFIRHIAEFWRDNKQFFEITIDKLMNYGVLDSDAVCEWSIGMFDTECDRWYIWSILKNCVHKSNLRVMQDIKEGISLCDWFY